MWEQLLDTVESAVWILYFLYAPSFIIHLNLLKIAVELC